MPIHDSIARLIQDELKNMRGRRIGTLLVLIDKPLARHFGGSICSVGDFCEHVRVLSHNGNRRRAVRVKRRGAWRSWRIWNLIDGKRLIASGSDGCLHFRPHWRSLPCPNTR